MSEITPVLLICVIIIFSMVLVGVIGIYFEKQKKDIPSIVGIIFVFVFGILIFFLIKYSFIKPIDKNWDPYKEKISRLCRHDSAIYSEQFASGKGGNHRIDTFVPIFMIDKHSFLSEDEIIEMDYRTFKQVACVIPWYELTGGVYGLKGLNISVGEDLHAAIITWGVQVFDISREQIIAQNIIIGPKPPGSFLLESDTNETIEGCSCYGITPIAQFIEWFDSLPILN